jgi:drug/metabolite transporter (DMT)-like permease
MPVAAVVVLAAVLHAVWNSLLKPIEDRLAVFALGGLTTVVPCLLAAPFVAPDASAWPFIAASGVLHLVYGLLLMRSYGAGDFNQVYPIARGISPLLVTTAAAVVAGEALHGVGLVGVVLVSAGLTLLAGRPQRGEGGPVALAAATGVVIASYSVVDGLGVRHSGAVAGYTIWLFAIQGALMALVMRRSLRAAMPRIGTGTLAATMSIVAYGLVIWAQNRGALGPIAALRETSVIFAAAIGALAFHERFGLRRLLASAVVLAGVILLAV